MKHARRVETAPALVVMTAALGEARASRLRDAVLALPDVALSASARSVRELRAALADGPADVVVVDVGDGTTAELALARVVAEREAAPALVGVSDRVEAVVALARYGARDCVLRAELPRRLPITCALVAAERAARPAAAPKRVSATPERLRVMTDGEEVLLEWTEVLRVCGDGNYVQVVTRGGTHVVRATVTEVERVLEPFGLVRVHRSHLVQVDHVASIRPGVNGDAWATLVDGTRVPVSRSYRPRLNERLVALGRAVLRRASRAS